MDDEKQAGAITLAGVIEKVEYTFEISKTRGCAEQEQVLLKRRLDALFRKEFLPSWVLM